MKEKVQSITFGAAFIYLCCYFMKLADFPDIMMLFLGAVLCLIMVVAQREIRIDLGICFLAVTMISYAVILYGKRGVITMLPYIPLLMYMLANYLSSYCVKHEKSENKQLQLIMALTIGYAVHGILNSYMYFAGYVVEGTRRWNDFWTNSVVPGTQHVIYFLPVFAVLVPMALNFGKRRWIALVSIVVAGFFCYASLATRVRMAFVILAAVLCEQVVLYGILERQKFVKLLQNKKVWIAGVILIVSGVGAIVALKDTALISNFLESLGRGGGILNNVRFETQRKALQQLFVYPMGGRQMELGRSYAHNVWLDMANAAGLIPFTFFVAYTLYTTYELIRVLLKKSVSSELKMLYVGLYTVFFLYFTVEPALDASIHYITPWIFVNGMVRGTLKDKAVIVKMER